MDIPFQRLDPESLRAVITEYVTRESTETRRFRSKKKLLQSSYSWRTEIQKSYLILKARRAMSSQFVR